MYNRHAVWYNTPMKRTLGTVAVVAVLFGGVALARSAEASPAPARVPVTHVAPAVVKPAAAPLEIPAAPKMAPAPVKRAAVSNVDPVTTDPATTITPPPPAVGVAPDPATNGKVVQPSPPPTEG